MSLWEILDELFTTKYLSMPVPKKDEIDLLIEALTWVESRGDVNAIGDKNIPVSKGGPAYGILQIRGGVLSEVNALWETKYKGADLLGTFGAKLSKNICKDYFTKVCPQYKSFKSAEKDGIPPQENYSKCWNGGVGWYLLTKKKGYETYKKNLDIYWRLVQTRLSV